MIYHLRQAFAAMRANLTAALATLTTMILTLTLLGLVSLITLNLERITHSIEHDVQIAAFLTTSVTPEEARAKGETVRQTLLNVADVDSVTFISKDEAYERLKRDYPYLERATQIITNPLPDFVEIKLKSARSISNVAAEVRTIDGVEDVEYGDKTVENVVNAISAVRIGGFGLVALLIANTLFNILNTIRVAMYARRDEINVMRLIGATRGFIRMPYLLEGIGLGLIAGITTGIIIYPTYQAGASALEQLAPFLSLERDPAAVLKLIALEIGLGAMLGLFGSIIAANRYLREVE